MLGVRSLSLLSVMLLVVLAGCGNAAQAKTSPPPSTPTISTQGVTNNAGRTATPAFVPITPAPTLTPLFRVTEISFDDYGQHLTLFVGDIFILHRFAYDERPLTIDNPNVLQTTNDPGANVVTLKAIRIGKARISSLLIIPCPTAPRGCQPPWDYTYVSVNVVEH